MMHVYNKFHRLFIFVCSIFVDSANLENLLLLKISRFTVSGYSDPNTVQHKTLVGENFGGIGGENFGS